MERVSYGAWSACGVSRLHGLAELPLRRLAAGLRTASWSAALSWQALGGDVWREDQVVVRTSFTTGPASVGAGAGAGPSGLRPWCGLDLRWRRPRYAAVAGDDDLEVGPVAGLSCGGVAGTVHVLPLVLRRGAESVGPRPWLAVRRLDDAWSASILLERADRGVASWRAGGDLRLGAAFCCGLVTDGAGGAVGVTTAWRRGRLLVRTSHLVHPVLGTTHRWDLAVVPVGKP